MPFDYKKLSNEFDVYTNELIEAYEMKDYYKSVCFLKFLTYFYYEINYKMSDEILEELTAKVAHEYLGETNLPETKEREVIFYDGFGLETRGLANIYVKALISLNYQVKWVLYDFAPEKYLIMKNYSNEKNVQFEIIPKLNIMERMKWTQSLIKKIKPAHIFVYTVPNDVEGIAVCSTIKGKVNRYLIDLTDHAYWLGKYAVDYIIGFRNVGCNVALQHRNIEASKILMLPYYADKRNYAYEGMPFGQDREFIFSGGSIRKIEGHSAYEEMVEYILEKYPKLYFVYAGNGKSEKLDKLSIRFEERFYQIPERKDLDSILHNAKFYLDTYPISGCLMTQYALQNECFPLCLSNKDFILENPATWLFNQDKIDFIFYSKDELYQKIDLLMTDEHYYQSKKKKLRDFVISEEDFKYQLDLLLKYQRTDYKWKEESIDITEYLELYKKNMNYERYCQLIYHSRNPWIWEKHKDIIVEMEKKNK